MQDDEINLIEYWNILWKRKILIIILTFVWVTATMIVSLRSPKFYKAETVIITSSSDAGGLGAALSSLPFAGMLGGAAGFQSQGDKLMVVLKSRTAAEAVIQRFDLLKIFNEDKWDKTKVQWMNPDDPPLLEDAIKTLNMITKFERNKEGAIKISAEWRDKKLSADIANYYVAALTNFLKDKSMNITIQVVDYAVPPERKSGPKIKQNMMIAGMTSLFISIFMAFIIEYFEKNRKNR